MAAGTICARTFQKAVTGAHRYTQPCTKIMTTSRMCLDDEAAIRPAQMNSPAASTSSQRANQTASRILRTTFWLRSFLGVRRKTPSRRAMPWTQARAMVQLDARLMTRLKKARRRDMFVHCRSTSSMLTRATAIRLIPSRLTPPAIGRTQKCEPDNNSAVVANSAIVKSTIKRSRIHPRLAIR